VDKIANSFPLLDCFLLILNTAQLFIETLNLYIMFQLPCL